MTGSEPAEADRPASHETPGEISQVTEPVSFPAGAVERLADSVLHRPARLGTVRAMAIDGPSGSGKSSLADAVAAELRRRDVGVSLVRADDFATWSEPWQWWPGFEHAVLTPLRAGAPAEYRRIVWSEAGPVLGDVVRVPVPEVLVLEGVSMGRRAAEHFLSYRVWITWGDEQRRRERSIRRDGETIREPIIEWQRFEREWFAEDQTPRRADLIITQRGWSTPTDSSERYTQ
ncbi:uridine kinase family protein [Actinoalloteichus hymeniacidonis]|uniref:Uridine kinase n=1 Tax=Actinoalloteichus hymeniacidonis TaxID=340345 RepID=A0AAC9HKN4_9PSEU|nr:uridine kinase [Actinoalloteichus hymeniacidonis]AOS61058.1 uridine kinase [Actinoalloteichus hymeniacidonis]MBB5910942.1 hypothetical protein [Actinoalloteichus hymeniacidonis]